MKTGQHNNFGILRLVLATLVVFGHFRILPGGVGWGIYNYADLAVDGFFIVSGFLVSGSIDKQPAVIAFYIKRIFRVYPLYIIVILLQLFAMLALLPGPVSQYAHESARYLVTNMLFLNFLQPYIGGLLDNAHDKGINPSLWTLKIEMGFYLFLPLLWYLTRKFTWIFLLAAYAASTMVAMYAKEMNVEFLARQLPGLLRFFIVGMALYYYQHKINLPRLLAFAAAIALAYLVTLRHEAWAIPLYPIAVGFLMFIVALKLPAIAIRFDISYGVYLIHAPLIQIAILTGWYHDSPAFLVAILALVYALALLAEALVERPGIEWGKKLARRFSTPERPHVLT